ncbi:MAG: bifunctional (p)ppGpp synthetase/guanosine-3',5'-bis(diphosphate) 3'-pyrophosphohydrolase [Firmicutes bacterium]|nr:bifunctional (p)ppGpp synthetase/guanosine-3',5'-bis(diphosphate) 3'-pyrophosphohydrolase [Bacillota bacterium]
MARKLEKTIERVLASDPDAKVDLIRKAYEFADRAHQGQFRDSGESFIDHPVEVAEILAELGMDVETIVAGILHDVLEDTSVTREELTAQFGKEICLLVDGVTKLSRIPFQSKEEQHVENLRKMFLAMAEDLRVIVIKLADRLHNMRTLKHLPEDRQRKIANETLEIYTPLAHRLGMWVLKWELEDQALRYLEPGEYYNIVQLVAKKRKEREGDIEEVTNTLREKLAELGVRAEIQGRPKHFYSIYLKMKGQGKEFSEIYDLMAVRVIVDSVKDCYGVLGPLLVLWKPIPGRFKDYIAMPKSNMYQSLHTTVVGPKGEPLEIQIRTWEMHRTAEYGIAAHWRYKEGDKGNKDFEAKIAWLRQILEWQKDMKDAHDFMETLKIDLFTYEVFVFTPKGDVKTLPVSSTPVDFAYSVHTDIGHRCIGAKVNGKIVPLDYQLHNGEFVEILTSKTAEGPSQDWLSFVKTSRARSKIRQWLKEERREESAEKGRELLEKEVKKHGLDVAEVLKIEKLTEVAKRYGFANTDDLLASVGFGRVTSRQVLGKLIDEKILEIKKRELKEKYQERRQGAGSADKRSQGIIVPGVDNLLVKVSRCCNPVPGDKITGYITRGRGVSVHRADCPNVANLRDAPDRRIEVYWNEGGGSAYPVEIEVEAVDRANLLTNVMNSISETKANIVAVNARTTKNRMAIINLVVDIRDVEHMELVMKKIKKVEGVLNVFRANPT